MPQVDTLNGPLSTDELGTVLMHEHIFNLTAETRSPIRVSTVGTPRWRSPRPRDSWAS